MLSTEIDRYKAILALVKQKQDFSQCLVELEHLMISKIQNDRYYRAFDRSIAKNIENEQLRITLYNEAIHDIIHDIPDRFTKEEDEFLESLRDDINKTVSF